MDIGLNGVLNSGEAPSRVLIDLNNPAAQPEELQLELTLLEVSESKIHARRTWHSKFAAQESRRIELSFPVPQLTARDNRRLIVSAWLRNATGALLGQSHRVVRPEGREGQVIVLMCEAQRVCTQIQSAILFTGPVIDQAEKSQDLRFVQLQHPGENWWAYAPSGSVLLARSARTLAPQQRAALEGYVRNGGKLVVAESELAGDSFLAAYRRGNKPGIVSVGQGELQVLPNLASGNWASAFTKKSSLFRRAFVCQFGASELSYTRWRLGTNFRFPGIVELLLWLALYLIVVGPLNFFLLHRTSRRELGWITIPAVSLLFAVALYATSAARRPRSLSVDEIAVDWMDDRSTMAAREGLLRVASPSRADVRLNLAGDALVMQKNWSYYPYMPGIGAVIDGPEQDFHFGPPQAFQVSLSSWSYVDFRVESIQALPGTLRRDGNLLRNETARSFREAILADRERVYFLGAVGAGAIVDLSKARSEPLHDHIGRSTAFPRPYALDEPKNDAQELKEAQEWEATLRSPFSVIELIRGWPSDVASRMKRYSAVFIGISEEPAVRAGIEGREFAHKQHLITWVNFLADSPEQDQIAPEEGSPIDASKMLLRMRGGGAARARID